MKFIFSLIASLLFLLSAGAQASESEPVDTGKVVAQLVSSHETAAAGDTIYVALRTMLDEHWHTYWRNPGDSGEPVQIEWTLPEGAAAGDIVWPLPSTIATGPIVNYGFEGIPYFPVPITLPRSAQPGETLRLEAGVYYLVCKDVCIPESADLSLDILIGDPVKNGRWAPAIELALAAAPKPSNILVGISESNGQVTAQFGNLPKGDFTKAFFFPYDQGVLLPGDPQVQRAASQGFELKAGSDYAWQNTLPEHLDGVLKFVQDGQDVGVIVQAGVGKTINIGKTAPSPNASPAGVSFWGAVISAFIGGLILNLMPCVFPVISIKALSLAKSAHTDRERIRKEGWLYTFGVLAAFLLLTIIVLLIKQAGTNVGWGFQLQSPKVVGVLALLLFAIGLNLLGVFEFGTALQNTGSGLAAQGGNSGAFFTGALAVVVATPCTAPFMAGAIGYAMAQPALIMICVFMALAVGFALPFLLLAYMPRLLTKLPKPGPWMVRFRELLAFPMLSASIWLVWVLSLQAGADGVALVLIAMLLLGFALWCFKRTGLTKGLGLLCLVAAAALPLTANSSGASAQASNHMIERQAWSPETVEKLRAGGQNVFVDFTAAWCVTCKVNERLVLETSEAKALFESSGTAFLVADWTNKNDEIATELARHGRSGVPLYLVFKAGNDDVNPVILPQVLTQSVLRDALLGP